MKSPAAQDREEKLERMAVSSYRADPSDAAVVASILCEHHAALGALSQFLQAPWHMPDRIAAAVMRNWLATTPDLLRITSICLGRQVGSPASNKWTQDNLDIIYSASLRIAIEQFSLEPVAAATEFSNCIMRAAPSAFDLHQRCCAPKQKTLKSLATSLQTYLHNALPCMAAAKSILVASHHRIDVQQPSDTRPFDPATNP